MYPHSAASRHQSSHGSFPVWVVLNLVLAAKPSYAGTLKDKNGLGHQIVEPARDHGDSCFDQPASAVSKRCEVSFSALVPLGERTTTSKLHSSNDHCSTAVSTVSSCLEALCP